MKPETIKDSRPLDARRKDNSERNAERNQPRGGDQGIRKDQRGQEQPIDNRRAQHNR
jgi:hypothetical protein